MLCTRIGHSIGTENLVPEEVNYTKIAIRVTVMNKVQFLLASLRHFWRWRGKVETKRLVQTAHVRDWLK